MAYMTRHRAKVARDNLALEFQHIEGCHVWRVSAAATAAGRMHVGRLHETREQQSGSCDSDLHGAWERYDAVVAVCLCDDPCHLTDKHSTLWMPIRDYFSAALPN